ncbi:hypothetical protein NDI49_11970 [Trichocoleus sp. ST-U3]|uniref:hypothetical protein n=1 Tax=Coleofasciculus sp. FACHB-542 TaxID=2692787 RepID=UPI001683D51D|nr:hypothetical protein [Coleofasciculus sp. FACHB-542]MBD2084349.1 hypothetical protein [Coleofasciculus sp. FACHB-542]
MLLTVVYPETHFIYPLLPWAEKGKIAIVELAKVVVLWCPNVVVFKAISTRATFQPPCNLTLGSDALLVDQQQLKALKQELAWAGLLVSEQF